MHTTSAPRPYLACLGTMQHGHERGQCVTAQGIPEVWEPLQQGRGVRSTARPSTLIWPCSHELNLPYGM